MDGNGEASEKKPAKDNLDPKKLRPPDKKGLEVLLGNIRLLELVSKNFNSQQRDKAIQLRNVRAEKDSSIDRRKKIDQELKSVSQEITKRMGILSKNGSGLPYKNENKINDAVRKLEYQLKINNFKLSEEKKIVAEIDSLKRSKKLLAQYLMQKKEIDELRIQQQKMRKDRDLQDKRVTELKSKEDMLRKSLNMDKLKVSEMKRDLDEMHERKRQLNLEIKKQEKEYYALRDETRKKQRQESLKRREEERKAQMERKQREEYEVHRDPYEERIQLCNALMTYLQRHLANSDQDPPSLATTPAEESLPAFPQACPAEELEDENGRQLILLKKPEEELFGGIGRRANKRSKKGRKQSVTKPLTHTPQIFSQFASLNLNAPSSHSEITSSLEHLQARKRFFESQSSQPQISLECVEPKVLMEGCQTVQQRLGCWGFMNDLEENCHSEGGNSATESAVCEMSRQASHTESMEEGSVVEHVLDDLAEISKKVSSELLPSKDSVVSDLDTPTGSVDSEETVLGLNFLSENDDFEGCSHMQHNPVENEQSACSQFSHLSFIESGNLH